MHVPLWAGLGGHAAPRVELPVWHVAPDAASAHARCPSITSGAARRLALQGLRIDYVLCTPGLLRRVVSCEVLSSEVLPPKWSDHAGGRAWCTVREGQGAAESAARG